jgi:CRP/FNR family transcriptional regulator, cyclic AMP receptor protein
MDTSSFFNYPTLAGETSAPVSGILSGETEEDWDALLAYTETRRFRPHDWLIRQGERDRALYLLSDGRLETHAPGRTPLVIEAPAIVGEVAFLDGLPHAAGVRALTHGEAQRLSYEALEALSAREPRLARDLLVDVGRIVAARLRQFEAAGG